jgi:hypothetical protein
MSDWTVSLFLCDAAQVADGKLYVMGGGWSLCGPGLFKHALAAKIHVPWDQADRVHQLTAELRDEDDQLVELAEGHTAVRIESEFEVGRPPGLPPGTPLDFPFAVNFGPMELPPGRGYSWRLQVDGQEIHRSVFRTRPGTVD